MKVKKIDDMVKGWFVGAFEPNVLTSEHFEVAVKYYVAGDYEKKHVHKVSKEITVLVYGKAEMNGVVYSKGDIILLEPLEPTDFKAIEDCCTVVVKTPSVSDDKYLVE